MKSFLRNFDHRSFKDGIMSHFAFRCNDGSLSFYERRAPLETVTGAQALRDSRQTATGLTLGLFELTESDLRPFGLLPVHAPTPDDAVYGDHHAESECFETIFGVEDAGDLKAVTVKSMNLRKQRLAQIAQGQIVVQVP